MAQAKAPKEEAQRAFFNKVHIFALYKGLFAIL
jgi:hypothetical protein